MSKNGQHIATVANRVFVGYPWNPYKQLWERLIADMHKRYPLHFLAIGREPAQPASQLLTKIFNALETSSAAVFDASTGNANVSLEYGYFRATRGEEGAYLFLDEDARIPAGNTPIISDLAGTVANRYKPTDDRMVKALDHICKNHPYYKRFEKFCRQRRYKGGQRKFVIRVFRLLDGHESLLRRELLDDLMHQTGWEDHRIEVYIKALHEAGLITITRGNHNSSRVQISG